MLSCSAAAGRRPAASGATPAIWPTYRTFFDDGVGVTPSHPRWYDHTTTFRGTPRLTPDVVPRFALQLIIARIHHPLAPEIFHALEEDGEGSLDSIAHLFRGEEVFAESWEHILSASDASVRAVLDRLVAFEFLIRCVVHRDFDCDPQVYPFWKALLSVFDPDGRRDNINLFSRAVRVEAARLGPCVHFLRTYTGNESFFASARWASAHPLRVMPICNGTMPQMLKAVSSGLTCLRKHDNVITAICCKGSPSSSASQDIASGVMQIVAGSSSGASPRVPGVVDMLRMSVASMLLGSDSDFTSWAARPEPRRWHIPASVFEEFFLGCQDPYTEFPARLRSFMEETRLGHQVMIQMAFLFEMGRQSALLPALTSALNSIHMSELVSLELVEKLCGRDQARAIGLLREEFATAEAQRNASGRRTRGATFFGRAGPLALTRCDSELALMHEQEALLSRGDAPFTADHLRELWECERHDSINWTAYCLIMQRRVATLRHELAPVLMQTGSPRREQIFLVVEGTKKSLKKSLSRMISPSCFIRESVLELLEKFILKRLRGIAGALFRQMLCLAYSGRLVDASRVYHHTNELMFVPPEDRRAIYAQVDAAGTFDAVRLELLLQARPSDPARNLLDGSDMTCLISVFAMWKRMAAKLEAFVRDKVDEMSVDGLKVMAILLARFKLNSKLFAVPCAPGVREMQIAAIRESLACAPGDEIPRTAYMLPVCPTCMQVKRAVATARTAGLSLARADPGQKYRQLELDGWRSLESLFRRGGGELPAMTRREGDNFASIITSMESVGVHAIETDAIMGSYMGLACSSEIPIKGSNSTAFRKSASMIQDQHITVATAEELRAAGFSIEDLSDIEPCGTGSLGPEDKKYNDSMASRAVDDLARGNSCGGAGSCSRVTHVCTLGQFVGAACLTNCCACGRFTTTSVQTLFRGVYPLCKKCAEVLQAERQTGTICGMEPMPTH